MTKRSYMQSISGDLTNYKLVDILEQDSSTIFTYETKTPQERHNLQPIHKDKGQMDVPTLPNTTGHKFRGVTQ